MVYHQCRYDHACSPLRNIHAMASLERLPSIKIKRKTKIRYYLRSHIFEIGKSSVRFSTVSHRLMKRFLCNFSRCLLKVSTNRTSGELKRIQCHLSIWSETLQLMYQTNDDFKCKMEILENAIETDRTSIKDGNIV